MTFTKRVLEFLSEPKSQPAPERPIPIRETGIRILPKVRELMNLYPVHTRWVFSECAHCKVRYAAYRRMTKDGPETTIRQGICSEVCRQQAAQHAKDKDNDRERSA